MNKLLIALLATIAVAAQASTITGAGATFPAPVYSKWAEAYKAQTGLQLNYQAIGSGGGIKQIDAKTVDFGATDDPRKQPELTDKKQSQFATVKGGVVAVVNIPDVTSNQINLTARQLGEIYEGKITNWKQVDSKLPDMAITRVVRADSSGTTAVFTGYLAKTGSDIKAGKTVKWSDGLVVAGKGNAGVAALVQQTKGTIGYVEYAYAKQGNLVTTRLNGAEASFDNFVSGKYELTAATYVIFYNEGVNQEAVKFWLWAIANGDKMAQDLDYVPLSAKEKAESVKVLKSLK